MPNLFQCFNCQIRGPIVLPALFVAGDYADSATYRSSEEAVDEADPPQGLGQGLEQANQDLEDRPVLFGRL